MKLIYSKQLIRDFKKTYQHLIRSGLEVRGLYLCDFIVDTLDAGIIYSDECRKIKNEVINAEQCIMHLVHPFIFNTTRIPKVFMNVAVVSTWQTSSLPKEFQANEFLNWLDPQKATYDNLNPRKYLSYVERNKTMLRNRLNDSALTTEQILDMLTHGSFEELKWKHELLRREYEILNK